MNSIDWFLGSLTEEEMKVSSYLTQMWTNFAVNGKPGLGAVPWNSTHQKYMKVVVRTLNTF